MRSRIALAFAAALPVAALTGCNTNALADACKSHGGIASGSVEKLTKNGAVLRVVCNDGHVRHVHLEQGDGDGDGHDDDGGGDN